MLVLPRGLGSYMVFYDASCVGICVVLIQDSKAIVYASQQLKLQKRNYPAHNLEFAASIHAPEIKRHCLYGVSCEIILIIIVFNICSSRRI